MHLISWKSLKIFRVFHSAPCWSTDTWWEATGRGRTESSLSPGRSRGRRSSGGWGGQRTSASSWRGCSQWWWTLARYRKSTVTQGGSVDFVYIFHRNNWKYLPVEITVNIVSMCLCLSAHCCLKLSWQSWLWLCLRFSSLESSKSDLVNYWYEWDHRRGKRTRKLSLTNTASGHSLGLWGWKREWRPRRRWGRGIPWSCLLWWSPPSSVRRSPLPGRSGPLEYCQGTHQSSWVQNSVLFQDRLVHSRFTYCRRQLS